MKKFTLALSLMLIACLVSAPAFAADALSFSDPSFMGQADTTSNEWDVFYAPVGNTPDVSEDATHSGSTVAVSGPGFTSGSNNFYAFGGSYEVAASVFAPEVSGAGTHVVVQLANTVGYGAHSNVQVFDDGGSLLSDSPFNESEIFNGSVSSSFGPVTQVETMFEFWLDGYTGDLSVSWTNGQHSSFKAVRIDTLATSSTPAAAAVPEPSSIAMIGIAVMGLGIVARRRRNG